MAGKRELIGRVPLFAQCSDREVAAIARIVRRLELDAGQTLTREGERGEDFFVIDRGRAKVTTKGRQIASLGPGDFFGEMALLTDYERSATVAATEPMVVYAIGDRDFQAMLDRSPRLVRKIMVSLADKLRTTEKAATYP